MKTTVERMAKMRKRKKVAGLVRVEFWIPSHAVDSIREYVKSLIEMEKKND